MAAAPALPQGFEPAKLYVWVKSLESKVNVLLREVDVLKNDFVKRNQDLRQDVRVLSEDLLEVKHQHEKMLQTMDLVIKELKQTAGVEEVQVLKKYVEFWNPMQFVTQQDLDRALESKPMGKN
ncbi:hypothetical protein HYU22_01080 [Candidatus Woesearchaeota archaeon]|nr:hypothetical protein [Candidatus Woesearchaeota archaeon]